MGLGGLAALAAVGIPGFWAVAQVPSDGGQRVPRAQLIGLGFEQGSS